MLIAQAKENIQNDVRQIVRTKNAFYEALNEKVRSNEIDVRNKLFK
jgi:hypothetical protein